MKANYLNIQQTYHGDQELAHIILLGSQPQVRDGA
jgi:hypothetical protein